MTDPITAHDWACKILAHEEYQDTCTLAAMIERIQEQAITAWILTGITKRRERLVDGIVDVLAAKETASSYDDLRRKQAYRIVDLLAANGGSE